MRKSRLHGTAINELQGHRTASGEMVNPSGMTVAHKSPPFGTCLVVGNPKTGKSVAVHVNDRGPFTAGLTLDLSAGAVQAIGMRSTERVTMRRCCIARWSVDDRPSRCRQSKPTIGPGTRLEQRRVNFKRSEMAASFPAPRARPDRLIPARLHHRTGLLFICQKYDALGELRFGASASARVDSPPQAVPRPARLTFVIRNARPI
jgi:rare lipoprotein A